MGHSHSHHHHHHAGDPHDHHHHGHGPVSGNIGRLAIVLCLTALYMVIEFYGGLRANSLALLADAGHMLTDVGAIALALFAAWFAEHPSSSRKTFGYYRLEILAAFINGVALAIVSLSIFYEAYQRFQHPPAVQGQFLMLVAAGGFIINLISAAILFTAGQKNLNMRAAFIHLASDSLGSLGALVAGALILYFGFYQADPLFSVLIALLVLVSSWKLILETTNVLLEGCPVHLSVHDIERALTDLHEVKAVHDLHVWAIATGKEAMSVHIVVEDLLHFTPNLLNKIQAELKDKFGLTHVTVQLETPDFEEESLHYH